MCAGSKLQVGTKAHTTGVNQLKGYMMEIVDFLGLVLLCVLGYFFLCRLFAVDKLTRDQLERYNEELEKQRWILECNGVPSNHQCEKMAEQAVMEGKTQEDNPFPYGTRDYGRWLCAYFDFSYKQQVGDQLKDWLPIGIAPKDATEVKVRMHDGTIYRRCHFACDTSGEYQAPFAGWFIQQGDGFMEIGAPKEWLPISYSDCPIGTKAHAVGGGCWIKVERGWKWATSGCVFPTPGADVIRIELPENKVAL